MQQIFTIQKLRKKRKALAGSVGFIPTMGFLHDGHVSLIKQAKKENDSVVVSIFINPTQFGEKKDFTRYPRNLNHDLDLLKKAGVDLVFIPSVEEIFPLNFQTYIDVKNISLGLEGEHRPGHFQGVATVVCKLLNIIQPNKSYFGQKDAQQCAVIKQMVKDLAIPIDIVILPTVRADDGVALSSRNSLLNIQQRKKAPILFQALQAAREKYDAGSRSTAELKEAMRDVLASEPLIEVEYVSVNDAETLIEADDSISAPTLFSLAVKIGNVRLIDNLVVR